MVPPRSLKVDHYTATSWNATDPFEGEREPDAGQTDLMIKQKRIDATHEMFLGVNRVLWRLAGLSKVIRRVNQAVVLSLQQYDAGQLGCHIEVP